MFKQIIIVAVVEDETLVQEQINKQTLTIAAVPGGKVTIDRLVMTDQKPAVGITDRRVRIAQLQTDLQKLVRDHIEYHEYQADETLIWQLEGDSVVPENCLQTLVEKHLKYPEAAISGIQIGRHGLYCIGAWHISEREDVLTSVDHRSKGLQQVDGMGLYCYVIKANHFLSGRCWWEGEHWGCDVNFFRSMPEVPKYVIMELHVGHYYKGGIIEVDSLATCNARYTKIVSGEWLFEQLD